MIVTKAVNMAKLMNIPILGMVENMSYLSCPDCGKKIEVFGKSKAEQVAAANGIKLLEKLPIEPELAELVDKGQIELGDGNQMDSILSVLEDLGLSEKDK